MTEVLIVGAGPTGLTLACVLARSGVSFRLIEAAPGPQVGSRGKGVQPRTLEVFEDLGIVEQVLAHGRMGMPVRSYGPDGQVVLAGGMPSDVRPDTSYQASLITPEWRVEDALRGRLAELGGAVEFGTALSRFEQSEDGVAAVVVRAGSEQTVRARWLVGCDGGHSVVRKQAGIAFVGETLEDVRMLVADVRVDGLEQDAWCTWRGTEGFVSLCPLPSTELFQYQASVGPGQDPSLELANLQATLVRRTGRTDIALSELEWATLWRANIRLVERYRVGRVFLAGDAAHIHSPAGGQGMNTGIQDAYNLGWKLAVGSDELLDSYEAERRPVAAGVLALSNARLAQVQAGKELPMTGSADTRQLNVNYRGTALVWDDRTDGLRAGDRAPGVNGGGEFTLLDFAQPQPSQLREWYGAGDRTLVLIRPDGYVAAISDAGDLDAILKHGEAAGLGGSPRR